MNVDDLFFVELLARGAHLFSECDGRADLNVQNFHDGVNVTMRVVQGGGHLRNDRWQSTPLSVS